MSIAKIPVIALWSGSIAAIPAGWLLCNGLNGTPDLRDQFIVGAGLSYAVDDSGGAVNHNHTFTTNGHRHDGGLAGAFEIGVFDITLATNTDTGTTDNSDIRPPYHSLAYIMVNPN